MKNIQLSKESKVLTKSFIVPNTQEVKQIILEYEIEKYDNHAVLCLSFIKNDFCTDECSTYVDFFLEKIALESIFLNTTQDSNYIVLEFNRLYKKSLAKYLFFLHNSIITQLKKDDGHYHHYLEFKRQ